jgi:hypothetical protein
MAVTQLRPSHRRQVCCIEQRGRPVTISLGSVTDRGELLRLRLRVQRAVLAQRQLRTLVVEADAALATVRRDLRNAKARVGRAASAARRSVSKEDHS